MKVLFDHQIFSYEKFGGISRYFSQLIHHLEANEHCSLDLSIKYSDNIYLNKLDKFKIKPFFNSINFDKKPGLLHLLNVRNSKRYLKNQEFDLFHPTFYNPYFLNYIGNKPFVLTVHDMITEMFPNMFPGQADLSSWKNILIHKANKIIAVSENTKKDIIRLFDVKKDKISVIYHGSSLNLEKSNEINHLNLPEKYLLFVGKRQYYKNFDRFIRAVSPLLSMDRQINVVCAGSTSFTISERRLFKRLEIFNKVFHLQADDRLLAALYKNALAFVYPSLYEGFGLPALEAFTCGCPAIISKTSSLPEVGGKAALYFDPEDESSITEAVKKVIYDKSLRNILRQEGFLRVKKFTWEHTALNTLKIYKDLCP